MSDDTRIGGAEERFPQTRWSAIVAAGSSDSNERTRAYEVLVASYWKPVYKYIRIKWGKSNEDAKDITQGFFTRVMEKDFFQGFDPSRARFRTFLRTCLDRYIANEMKAGNRQKRGGNAHIASLDFENAEGELSARQVPDTESMDDFFDQEWLRSLFALAIEALRDFCEKKGKMQQFEIFEIYDLNPDSANPPAYSEIAANFDIPVTQVTNYLAFARREFRRILLEKLRDITSSDTEFRNEARLILGKDPE